MIAKTSKQKDAHLQEQFRLLEKSEKTNIPLAEVLENAGWSYEDLIYEESKVKTWTGRSPLNLNEIEPSAQEIPMVSFFAGCGGMDLGMEAAGYKHLAAFEINELFCKTLRRNRPNWNVFGPPTHSGDVSKFDEVAETLSQIITAPFDGLFVGGPPCQPFSIASNQRFSKTGENFKRVGFLTKKWQSAFRFFAAHH